MTDAVQLAKNVLAAEGQPFLTLSLAAALPPVTVDTSVADARRSYMRLAGAIHPDRLQGTFPQATEAFQCLVRAFETFADPKLRKKAAAEAAKKAKASTPAAAAAASKTAAAKSDKAAKPRKEKAAAPKRQPRKVVAKAKKAAADDSEEESETPSSASDEESDGTASEASAAEENGWAEWAAADAEPEVSTSRTPIGQLRATGVYQQTTIGCPKCRSQWEPDSRPQYSLFMGHWGMHVHCQLCLFEFGSATALHNCPHCSNAFDYDASMYDEVQNCAKCKKPFGFAYYPVNQHLIDQVALEEWKLRKERQRAAEREARAHARRGGKEDASGGAAEAEQTQLWIGTCVMDEQCPLCQQRVKSKHRDHVLTCMTKAPEERAAAKIPRQAKTAAAAAAEKVKAKATVAAKRSAPKPSAKTVAKAAPRPSPKAAPKPAAKRTAKAKATPRKRRRGGDNISDDEDYDSESSPSDSDSEDISSESSLSDDDEDSD